MRFTITHPLGCDAETFFTKVYFDEDYTARLYLEALGCSSVEVLDQSGTPGTTGFRRRLESYQEVDAPGPVKKLIGDTVVTVEDGTFHASTMTWSFTIANSRLGDKINLSGTVAVADGQQAMAMDVKVKIPVVGGAVEKFVEKQTRDSQAKSAAFTRTWIAERLT